MGRSEKARTTIFFAKTNACEKFPFLGNFCADPKWSPSLPLSFHPPPSAFAPRVNFRLICPKTSKGETSDAKQEEESRKGGLFKSLSLGSHFPLGPPASYSIRWNSPRGVSQNEIKKRYYTRYYTLSADLGILGGILLEVSLKM